MKVKIQDEILPISLHFLPFPLRGTMAVEQILQNCGNKNPELETGTRTVSDVYADIARLLITSVKKLTLHYRLSSASSE